MTSRTMISRTSVRSFRKLPVGLAVAAAMLFGSQDPGELKSLLLNRTAETPKAVGIVVGLVDATGERFLAAGKTAPGGNVAPDADTVYEIGSITKVFTSLVLADMVMRGEVKLDDPVARFLPPTVNMPERDSRKITLLDLSNQVSGLPRMPDNFKPADMGDPYVDYGPALMYEFLAKYQLPRAIGEKYEYSNLGVGLLGHALALKAGMSYEELVRRRVLEPLGMSDTAITLPERLKARLAPGTGPNLSPVKNWNFDALVAAGGIRSTARDMLKFLTAAAGLRETPLRRAFDLMIETERPTGFPDLTIGLAWHIWRKYGNGDHLAQRGHGRLPFLRRLRSRREGGRCRPLQHLLQHRRHRPPRPRAAVARGPVQAAGRPHGRRARRKGPSAYVGEYELPDGIKVVVTQSGGTLRVKPAGSGRGDL